MTIDILSLIIGALMWEFVRGYFTGIIAPSVKQLLARDKKVKEPDTKTDETPIETTEVEA